jgi:hypothetical protein
MRRDLVADEVKYLVLPDVQNPWLLARVRWPDVFQAISPARPYWQSDPGLFDLPYDPSGVPISAERAEAIAAEWGATLPAEGEGSVGPSLIRRMPANWSRLTPAEKRAWSIGPEPRRRWRRPRGNGAGTTGGPEVLVDAFGERVIDLTDQGLAGAARDARAQEVIDLTDKALENGTHDTGRKQFSDPNASQIIDLTEPEQVIDLTGTRFEDVTWTEKS